MKLYDVPRNTMIVLPNSLVVKFHHIDGMYSVCTDAEGDLWHIAATTEVEIVKDKE
jgi:antirestriction protein